MNEVAVDEGLNVSDTALAILITGIVTPLFALAGVALSGWQQSRSQDKNNADAERRERAAHRRAIALQRREQVAIIRGRQADFIRAWIREQLASQIDASTFAAAAKAASDKDEFKTFREAAERLYAARGGPERLSVTPILVEVSDPHLIHAIRNISRLAETVTAPIHKLYEWVAETPSVPWGPEESARLDALTDEALADQIAFDGELAALNKLLEDYCLPAREADDA